MTEPILTDVTTAPSAAHYELYRWCDYAELRCLTHMDKRFSRDNLAEAIGESKDLNSDGNDELPAPDDLVIDSPDEGETPETTGEVDDLDERLSGTTFRHLRWRANVFDVDWPFEIDTHAQEIKLKQNLSNLHYLYLQLLLSALLKYCPKGRRKTYTGVFEDLSFYIFKNLMPQGSQVHQFGVSHSTRYVGKLFDRLRQLADDVCGDLRLTVQDFPKNDAGDGGLDLVAWHNLGDERDHIPIAFAQCGCTAEGWPNKMLEASPAKLGKKLVTGHDWATYYFMPIDLSDTRDGKMRWMEWRDVNAAIVIDRLRFLRLADADILDQKNVLTKAAVNEALAFALS